MVGTSTDEESSRLTQSIQSFPSGGLQLNRRPSVQFTQERRASCTNPFSHLCKQLEERAYLVGEGRIKVLLLTKLAPLMHSNDSHSTIQRFLLLHMLRVYLVDWDPRVQASALRCIRYSIRGRHSLDILTRMRIPELVVSRLEAGKSLAERVQAMRLMTRWLQFQDSPHFFQSLCALANCYPDDPLRERALTVLIFATHRHPEVSASAGGINTLIETGMLNQRFNDKYGTVVADVVVKALSSGEHPEILEKMKLHVWLDRIISPFIAIRRSRFHGDMRGVLNSVCHFVASFAGLVLLYKPLSTFLRVCASIPDDSDSHRRALLDHLIASLTLDARGVLLSQLLSQHVCCPQLVRRQLQVGLSVNSRNLIQMAKTCPVPLPNPPLLSTGAKTRLPASSLLNVKFPLSVEKTPWKLVRQSLSAATEELLHELTAFIVSTGFLVELPNVEVLKDLVGCACELVTILMQPSSDFSSTLTPALMSGLNFVLECRASDANEKVVGGVILEISKSAEGVKQLELYNIPALLCGLIESRPALVAEVIAGLTVRTVFDPVFHILMNSGSRRLRQAAIQSAAVPLVVLSKLVDQSFVEEERQACVDALVRRLQAGVSEEELTGVEFNVNYPLRLLTSLLQVSAAHFNAATATGWLQGKWRKAVDGLSCEDVEGVDVEVISAVVQSTHGRLWVAAEGVQLLVTVRSLLEDAETTDGVMRVLEILVEHARTELVDPFELLDVVETVWRESEHLAQIETCWNLLIKAGKLPLLTFEAAVSLQARLSHSEECSRSDDAADLSAYSDDPDEDLSPASFGGGRGDSRSSVTLRRSTLRRCMTQQDVFGRFAEMRMSLGSSSDDSELQMMEVERMSVASPSNFAVAPVRRFGERHREVLRKILTLNNPVLLKSAQSSLLKTKQHDPQLFYSVGLWLRVQKALLVFHFSLPARKFIHMLFENTFADPEALPYLDRLNWRMSAPKTVASEAMRVADLAVYESQTGALVKEALASFFLCVLHAARSWLIVVALCVRLCWACVPRKDQLQTSFWELFWKIFLAVVPTEHAMPLDAIAAVSAGQVDMLIAKNALGNFVASRSIPLADFVKSLLAIAQAAAPWYVTLDRTKSGVWEILAVGVCRCLAVLGRATVVVKDDRKSLVRRASEPNFTATHRE